MLQFRLIDEKIKTSEVTEKEKLIGAQKKLLESEQTLQTTRDTNALVLQQKLVDQQKVLATSMEQLALQQQKLKEGLDKLKK